MKKKFSHSFLRIYAWSIVALLFVPLVVVSVAAFNTSRTPMATPWKGFTFSWFGELFEDTDIWGYALNTLWVGIAVIALAVPIGTAAAILVNSLKGRSRTMLYAAMIAPVLTPGVVIGISTLIFWQHFYVPAGLHLSVLGQVSFIAAYVMLMVLARLQSFDVSLEEAALDLGATHWQMLRRVLFPHLYPAVIAASVLSFFQSAENYNTTQFTRGAANTLTVYIGSKTRAGATPSVNAFAFLLILGTLAGALFYDFYRKRQQRKAAG